MFARQVAAGQAAIVGVNRATTAQRVTVGVSGLGIADGTVLHDLLGAADVKVSLGQVTVAVPASGAVIYAP